jgi:outer membrane protein OmpA-like peptidoglycan-associated protein
MISRERLTVVLSAAFAVLLVPWTGPLAQTNEKTFQGEPTKEELIEALQPKQSPIRTRGLQPTTAQPAEPPAVSLDIKFEFDSARLTQDAMRQLDVLGAAITSQELRDYRFRLSGHTDSTGSAAYNLRLSQLRAQSTRSYLIDRYGINPGSLDVIGKGEAEPLDPGNPEDAKNRRVVVENIGK